MSTQALYWRGYDKHLQCTCFMYGQIHLCISGAYINQCAFVSFRVIKSLAKWNGKEVPETMLTNLLSIHQSDEQEKTSEKSMTVLDLFKTKRLRIKTFILSCKIYLVILLYLRFNST